MTDLQELRAAIRNVDDIKHHTYRSTPPEELGIDLRNHIHSLEIVLAAARETIEQLRRNPRRIGESGNSIGGVFQP
jgi:hypothetical protein